jgi:hypothetical protein
LTVAHKQTMCSGLSRGQQKNGIWKCQQHGGKPVNRQDTTGHVQQQNQPQQQKECVTCSKTIRKGLAPLLCSTCTNVSHATCTKLPRDQIIKLRTVANTWRCSVCLTPTNQANNTQPSTTELEKSKCYKCKGPICKGKEPGTYEM